MYMAFIAGLYLRSSDFISLLKLHHLKGAFVAFKPVLLFSDLKLNVLYFPHIGN